MAKFLVKTEVKIIREYEVKANTQADAEDNFCLGKGKKISEYLSHEEIEDIKRSK